MNASHPGQSTLLTGESKPAALSGQLEFSTALTGDLRKLHSQTSGKPNSPEAAVARASGQNVDWMDIPSAEVAPRHGVSASTPPPSGLEPSRSAVLAERIQQLVSHEVAHVKRMNADSLSVVVKPDPRTELLLHVIRRDGQMEAYVRMERGDLQHFQNHWSQLQESLARQNVRLVPLKEQAETDSTPGGLPLDSGEGQGSPNNHSSRKQTYFHHIDGEDFNSVRVVAKPRPAVAGGRLNPGPLQGWESWA